MEEFTAIQVHSNNQMQELFSAEGVKTTAGQDVAGFIRVKITKYSF